MGRAKGTVRKTNKKRRTLKGAAAKPRSAKGKRGGSSSGRVTRPSKELREALARQAATAGILQIIASSPSNVQPVFDAVAERAMNLLDCWSVIVIRFDGELVHFGAARGALPDTEKLVRERYQSMRPDRGSLLGRSLFDGRVISSADAQAEPDPQLREYARKRGLRAVLVVPLLRDGRVEGALVLTRAERGLFATHEIELVQTFADQAVIAIVNARLFDEVQTKTRDLEESLQRQTATAEVLKVISRSAFNLQAVLETLTQSAVNLCEANQGIIFLRDDDLYRAEAAVGGGPDYLDFLKKHPRSPGRESICPRVALSGAVEQIPDVLEDADYHFPGVTKISGNRALLGVPLLREGRVEGVFALGRGEPGAFTAQQIELVQIFADQAVIAIENARLFNETQEALERQTATADILKVIASSPSDVQPVFEAIANHSKRLIGGFSTAVFRFIDGIVHLASFTSISPEADTVLKSSFPRQVGELYLFEQAKGGKVVEEIDTEANPDTRLRDLARARGFRSTLLAPLMSNDMPIGLIVVTRKETGRFARHHIQLLQTFADQAVIAIENARLFNEVQERTSDLQESLQQQTATSEVLKVISRSAFDLDTVMNTLADSARTLCGSKTSSLFLRDGGMLVCRGSAAVKPEDEEFIKANPVELNDESHMGRAVLSGTIANVGDFVNNPHTKLRRFQQAMGFKSFLAVPLMREGRGIGVFTLGRDELGPFSQRQVELVQSFADQAVIAIENVRLFDEVQARTRELSQSLDDLRAAQDRLIQTEKLASLGQLTAGIAHEIKNPLNFVNNFSTLSAELTDELNEVLKPERITDEGRKEVDELTRLLRDNLGKVVQHSKRADSIVKNMLLHSREGSGERRPADINALVDESLNLAYHGARAEKPQFNVALHRDFDPQAGMVEVFPQEITRVLLNLISNGFYAVTKGKADNSGADFEPLVTASTRGRDDHVEISIRDNGNGIPREVKEKMFNPFFTTKPAGEGTGLGLSISHDIIVKQHGGSIEVQTEPGAFTEFIVTLRRKGLSKETRES